MSWRTSCENTMIAGRLLSSESSRKSGNSVNYDSTYSRSNMWKYLSLSCSREIWLTSPSISWLTLRSISAMISLGSLYLYKTKTNKLKPPSEWKERMLWNIPSKKTIIENQVFTYRKQLRRRSYLHKFLFGQSLGLSRFHQVLSQN